MTVNLSHFERDFPAVENLADHFTHFYLFFMPDFAREVYATEAWYAPVAARFRAIKGSAAREALQARASWMEIMGLLAGKWPHTLSIQPGGSTRAISRAEKVQVLTLIRRFRQYLEATLFGDSLEAVGELASAEALHAWSEGRSSDFAQFLQVARALELAVIAEGVEDETQRRIALEEGCSAYQGFLRARPLPHEEFLALASGQA